MMSLVVLCVALFFMSMVMVVIVQQPRADEVYTKTEHRDGNGLAEPDLNWIDETRYGLVSNEERNHRQYDCARKGREFSQLAGSQRKPFVCNVRAGNAVSDCGNRQSRDMRGHVEAIGYERHGAKQQAAGNLGNHHHGREDDDRPSSPLVLVVLFAEKCVLMLPWCERLSMHLSLPVLDGRYDLTLLAAIPVT
jgi:hypothetical protein